MAQVNRVIIIGGGIGGMTLGLALRQRGIECVVHEKYGHYQSHRTAFLIWSYAAAELANLGVPMASVAAPLEVLEVHGRKGSTICQMPVGRISRAHGCDSYEVNRKRLAQTMGDMLGDALVRPSCCIGAAVDGDRAIAQFEGGGSDAGDLIVGCDGAHSVIRKVLHPEADLELFGSGGWIAVLDEHPPGLEPNRQMEFWQPGIKAGLADIGNGECRWYVAMNGTVPDMKAPPSIDDVRAAIPNAHPTLQAAIDATSDDQLVLTQASDLLALDPWFDNRIVMLGDAAHATSPYAGMGACTAIRDAVVLADMLAEDGELTTTLQAFQDRRKPISDAVIKQSRNGLDMSASHSRFKAWLRDMKFSHIPDKAMEGIVESLVCEESP
ncbi:MAG: FAD-dependent monooxygenase [Phycisphaerales bacterium]|nr:FAD-dependent monooxygenase [Phycisphaerales bacterium]